MKPLLIAKMGSTFPALAECCGDFDDWIAARLGLGRLPVQTVTPVRGDPLPPPGRVSGIVMSGAHDMVTDRAEWSERAARWLVDVVEAGTPFLGICYGHQLLAHALGGEVGNNPRGREFGTVPVRFTDAAQRDPLFSGAGAEFRAHVCHAQSVLTLPTDATILAASDRDPHHVFVVGGTAWGVQFHPEFDEGAMRAYVREFAAVLRADGQDPDALLAGIAPTPESEAVLGRFTALVEGRGR